ncbi:MAG: SCO family protein [Bacteroidota bacterium]
MNSKNSIVLLLACLMCAACRQEANSPHRAEKESRVSHLPYYREARFKPHWMLPSDQALDTFHRISPFRLTNQDGESVTEQTFDGKIYVADFFFTFCPGICPRMTKNMAMIQEAFLDDDDVLLLSHSVTPGHDSVPVLKEYAEEKGVMSHKWHLVTGSQEDIYQLGRKDYFVEEDLGLQKEEDEFLHTENFVLVDKSQYIRGIYNGLNTSSIQQLIADIKTLKKEQ